MTDQELNMAVAEAAGIPAKIEPPTGKYRICYRIAVGLVHQESFRFNPIDDWNDAMEAAEKVGLLKTQNLTGSDMWGWYITDRQQNIIVQNKSGPRAICEAIVATKGGK